jgi:hypothetical protein
VSAAQLLCGSVPAWVGAQAPSATPVKTRAQARHGEAQAEAQQTPSVQDREVHCAPVVQAAPVGRSAVVSVGGSAASRAASMPASLAFTSRSGAAVASAAGSDASDGSVVPPSATTSGPSVGPQLLGGRLPRGSAPAPDW